VCVENMCEKDEGPVTLVRRTTVGTAELQAHARLQPRGAPRPSYVTFSEHPHPHSPSHTSATSAFSQMPRGSG
jgi:hypothetical protein